MASTKTRSNTSGTGSPASTAVAAAKKTGDSLAATARKGGTPMLAAGATVAGLAGGLALGSRATSKRRGARMLLRPRRKLLGVPLGRRSGLERTAKALGQVARELSSATNQVSSTADEVRQVREQLDRANRQSPVEVLLNGLTHRRGAHRRES